MTALAPNIEHARRLAELDARVRVAWRDYRDSLHELTPTEYDEREPAEWDQLQATLRDAGRRARPRRGLSAEPGPPVLAYAHAILACMHAMGMQTDAAGALADSLATFYGHAMRPSNRLIGEFERLDLSFTQFKALTAAADGEPTVKALAERLGLSLPGASRAVDQLARRGLLDRREDADDRRCKRLRSPTPAASSCTASTTPAVTRSRPSRRASTPRTASD